MYYQSTEIGDFRAVRYCAYSNLNGNDDLRAHIDAPAVLAMIYAGGRGVAPNISLAIKFACEISDGWDGGTALAKMLDAKQKQGATRVDLDVCDNPTGRQINYQCLMQDQARVNDNVDAVQKRFLDTGDDAQRHAFRQLLIARTAFLEAHDPEKPTGTSGIAQSNIYEDNEEQKAWAQTLNEFAAGKFPNYTEAQFKKADTTLNDEYQDTRQRTAKCDGQYCTTSDQVRNAERKWLAYREALVSYGKLRWPQVSALSWRTLLTIQRIGMLREIE